MNAVDAVIIGAGPAGSSTALALAKQGLTVVLIDKSTFPRPKVCGGFLGPQNKKFLSDLGIWQELLAQGAQLIEHSVLFSPDGNSVTLAMKNAQALGVSRSLLDNVLLDHVKKAGVTVLEGAKVKDLTRNSAGFDAKIDHYSRDIEHTFQARYIIDASGHYSPNLKNHKVQLGIAALFEDMPWTQNQVSLFCCPQGHVGINPFEGNRVNICYVVEAELFDKCDRDAQKVFDLWLNTHGALHQKLDGVKRLTPWKAVYIPVRPTIKLWENGIWYVGDAAAFINPVTGGGMSVALWGGQILAHALVTQKDQKSQFKAYQKSYLECFSGQRQLADLWGALAHHSWSANAVIKLLNSHEHFKLMSLRHSHPPVRLGTFYQN